MIAYATIGTNDLEKAVEFYDKVLQPLGGKRTFNNERAQFYGGAAPGMLAVCKPYDGEGATRGNGSMFGLPAASNDVVDATYAAALAAGGSCEGAPGIRGGTFYGAYFRDLDGNKLFVFKGA